MNHLDRTFGRCTGDQFNRTLVGVRCRRPREVPGDDTHRGEDGAYPLEKERRGRGAAMRTFVVALFALTAGFLRRRGAVRSRPRDRAPRDRPCGGVRRRCARRGRVAAGQVYVTAAERGPGPTSALSE